MSSGTVESLPNSGHHAMHKPARDAVSINLEMQRSASALSGTFAKNMVRSSTGGSRQYDDHRTYLTVPSGTLQLFSQFVIQPVPTYLNQFGLQSSFCNHGSPAKNIPVLHPLHFGEFGQLKNGTWLYPISLNQWILDASSNSPSAMLCTGASPQRS